MLNITYPEFCLVNIFHDGQELYALFSIGFGTFKTFIVNEQDEEQITGFRLAGDLLSFDAIVEDSHPRFAQALETPIVCEIPYYNLVQLSNTVPS